MKLLKNIFYVFGISLFLYFFIKFLYISITETAGLKLNINYILFFISVLFIISGFILQNITFYCITQSFHSKIPFKKSITIFSIAVLSAYIPGKLPGILLTSKFSEKYGCTIKQTTTNLIFYQLYSISGLLILILLISLVFENKLLTLTNNSLFLFFIILLVPPKFLYTKLRKYSVTVKKLDFDIIYTRHIFYILNIIVGWVLISLSIFLLKCSFFNSLNLDDFKIVVLNYLNSIFISNCAFIFPGGLGVYELSMYNSLSGLYAENIILGIMLVSRLMMVFPSVFVLTFQYKVLINK